MQVLLCAKKSLDVTLQSARPSDDGFILPNLNDSLPSLSCISYA